MICTFSYIFYISVKVLQPFTGLHRPKPNRPFKPIEALALRAAQAQEAQEALQMKLQAEAQRGGRAGWEKVLDFEK